jgi:hypothetical protein
MSLIIFIAGLIISTLFATSVKSEVQKENDEEFEIKNYYERHSLQRRKRPKTKQGSQSRVKNYFWKK